MQVRGLQLACDRHTLTPDPKLHGQKRKPLYGDLTADLGPWGVTPPPPRFGAREVLWGWSCTGLGKTATLRGVVGALGGAQGCGRLIRWRADWGPQIASQPAAPPIRT